MLIYLYRYYTKIYDKKQYLNLYFKIIIIKNSVKVNIL